MKPMEFLKWLLEESIDTEGMGIIDIDDEFDSECFFGYLPDSHIPTGKYAYLYSDMCFGSDIIKLRSKGNGIYTITTDMSDRMNDTHCIIYLIKLDE